MIVRRFIGYGVGIVLFANVGLGGELSDLEKKELSDRITRFYKLSDDPAVLFIRPPKFSLREQSWKRSPSPLSKTNSPSPLEQLAGEKMSEGYLHSYCERILKPHFPALYDAKCAVSGRAAIEPIDDVTKITRTFIDSEEVEYDLDHLPTTGKSDLRLWSDDYWRTQWGQTSYRYSTKITYSKYKDAIAAYIQPKDWLAIVSLPAAEIPKKTVLWSPAEKYDLSVASADFTLTQHQKNEGQKVLKPDGNVEEWMGLCHGWAAASVAVPAPMKSTSVVGLGGKSIEWYPADVRALLTLLWANGNYWNNFVGGRCNAKKVTLHPNGRIQQQECFDTNPATFHLALGNLVGIAKHSVVMDSTFDYEVWNQPIESYTFRYFNPLDPTKTDLDWKKVAADYDAAFKARDKFQKPLTRGVKNGTTYDDSTVKKMVGVMATVTYLVEHTPPVHSPTPMNDALERVTYTYDLELYSDDEGGWYPDGGEWHQNAHPDFLWVPQRGEVAKSNFDNTAIVYDGNSVPNALVTTTANQASKNGLPLCRVVKELVKRSVGTDVYQCPNE